MCIETMLSNMLQMQGSPYTKIYI